MRLSAPVFRLKRQAKLLTREFGIPLHQTLDCIARAEGFRSWSHLASRDSRDQAGNGMLQRLDRGDLVLLGGRPGQGKTLLGLELVVEAIKAGRKGYFFTLEYDEKDTAERLRQLGADLDTVGSALTIDTSNDICADHVMARLSGAPRDSLVVIDYLQLLDQKRSLPALADQMRVLKDSRPRPV